VIGKEASEESCSSDSDFLKRSRKAACAAVFRVLLRSVHEGKNASQKQYQRNYSNKIEVGGACSLLLLRILIVSFLHTVVAGKRCASTGTDGRTATFEVQQRCVKPYRKKTYKTVLVKKYHHKTFLTHSTSHRLCVAASVLPRRKRSRGGIVNANDYKNRMPTTRARHRQHARSSVNAHKTNID